MKRKLIIDDIPEHYYNYIIFATYKLWTINNNGTLNDIGIVGKKELLDYDEKEIRKDIPLPVYLEGDGYSDGEL